MSGKMDEEKELNCRGGRREGGKQRKKWSLHGYSIGSCGFPLKETGLPSSFSLYLRIRFTSNVQKQI